MRVFFGKTIFRRSQYTLVYQFCYGYGEGTARGNQYPDSVPLSP